MLEKIRQRIRYETTRFIGRLRCLEFSSNEHSAFTPNGDIVSSRDTNSPVVQGVVVHQQKDVVGQCRSCREFITIHMIATCEKCSHVICRPCARRWGDSGKTVCPKCLQYLIRRQAVLIAKKLLIHPFIEPRR